MIKKIPFAVEKFSIVVDYNKPEIKTQININLKKEKSIVELSEESRKTKTGAKEKEILFESYNEFFTKIKLMSQYGELNCLIEETLSKIGKKLGIEIEKNIKVMILKQN